MQARNEAALGSPSRRRLLTGAPPGMPAEHVAPPTGGSAARASQVSQPPAAVRWLSKATYGFTQAEMDAFNALGGDDSARWTAWINQQLDPAGINDGACDSRLASAGFSTLGKSVQQLWAQHHEQSDYYTRLLPLYETESAMVIRALYSRRQLFERMVGFWHDHFSVYGGDYDGAPMFVQYDRDVMRGHALGNFRTLLGTVARSTCMQFYLDNYASKGANFNENYGRELIELHTLGVENYYGPGDPFQVPCLGFTDIHCEGSFPAGYVDNDVYEAAAALTGWSIKNGNWQFPNDNDGTFVYRSEWHQHNNKFFLGRYLPANQPAMLDGEQVLDRLCAHPGTARHIATKLCRRFVGEDASSSLIDRVASDFTNHLADPDQISIMLRTVLESDEFKTGWGSGMKRPLEATLGALRAFGADFTPVPDNTGTWTVSDEFFSRLQQAGHRPFRWGPPNGYPDSMGAWASTGTLAMTMKLLARLPELPRDRSSGSPPLADVVAQTQSAVSNPTATNIISYWSDRVLGWQPQPLTGTVTAFMQQNAGTSEALDLSSDNWNSGNLKAHYVQSRLRTAVSMLAMNPEYLKR
ncbi:MAG: DUF1800 domain-containing protein [Rhodanobacteraceae bacterium]